MTDLVLLSDIQSRLQAQAETRVELDAAMAELQSVHDAYEADRVASAQTIDTLKAQVSERWALLDTLQAQVATLQAKLAVATADVHVTVGTEGVVSQFEPGISWISSSPITFDRPAWPALKANGSALYGVQSTHLFPFGLSDPWSKYQTVPANPAPVAGLSLGKADQSYSLTGALARMTEFGGQRHMKMYGAPWWMKHKVAANGTITQLTAADMYSDQGRVKASRLNDWLYLAKQAAKVALMAGVRWFSVWNELKGYVDGTTWDVSMNPGTGDTAMGYGYFYKRTSEAILAAAAELSILDGDVKIGGPYAVLRARSTATLASATTTVSGAWGYLDLAGYVAVEAFMANVAATNLRCDFISVDGADYNKGLATDGTAKPSDWIAPDDFANGQRYHAIHQWLAKWNKPIVWDEYYRYPCKKLDGGDAYDAVLAADFLRTCILDGVKWAFAWGPWSINFNGSRVPGQFTADGALTPYGNVTALFRKHFPPGTTVYQVTCSDGRVDGLASADTVLVYSKVPDALTVDVAGKVVAVAGHGVVEVGR